MNASCLQLSDLLTPLDEDQVNMLLSADEDNSTAFLQDLIHIFMQDNQPRLQALAEACAKQDLEALRQHAHFIAGSTANLGILRVSQLCHQVEHAIVENQFTEFDNLPDILNAEYKIGMDALRSRAIS